VLRASLRRKEEFFSAARVRRHKCLLHPVMVYIHAENTLDAEQGTDTCPHGGYEVAAVAEFMSGAANGVETHPLQKARRMGTTVW
jgi:hypothetical protein